MQESKFKKIWQRNKRFFLVTGADKKTVVETAAPIAGWLGSNSAAVVWAGALYPQGTGRPKDLFGCPIVLANKFVDRLLWPTALYTAEPC